jgi:apolipoprotein D and lipocalin family protein
LATLAAATVRAEAQPPATPVPVRTPALAEFTGPWYEVAALGSWWHDGCRADTVVTFERRGDRGLDVRASCSTAVGTRSRTGRIRALGPGERGTWDVKFASGVLGWFPAAWNDFWVIALGEGARWFAVGDRHRERLSVLSRTVSLDEASLAQAIARARAQGFDVDRLMSVPHGRPAARP